MAIRPKTLLKYSIFVREFIANGGKGALAAEKAGYTKHTAHVTASKLLKIAKVKQLLAEAQTKVLDKLDKTNADIQNEIDKLAFHDIRTLYNKDNALKPMSELTYEEQKLITKIKSTELFEGHGQERVRIGDTVEVGTLDRRGMLQDSAKIRGMFVTKLEVHDHRNLGEEMAEAQRRAREAEQ